MVVSAAFFAFGHEEGVSRVRNQRPAAFDLPLAGAGTDYGLLILPVGAGTDCGLLILPAGAGTDCGLLILSAAAAACGYNPGCQSPAFRSIIKALEKEN